MREESITDIVQRLDATLKSPRYINHLNDPIVNWLDIPIEKAITSVLQFLEELANEMITI